MTRSGDDEDTSVWCIRVPHPRHLQLNLDGHAHRNNIHAAGARMYRPELYGWPQTTIRW